jgi:hypothetical protein
MADPGANEKTRRFPHVLPGSRAMLFTLGKADDASYDDADVSLFIFETGETRVLIPGGTRPLYVPTGHIVFARGGKLFGVGFDPETYEVVGAPFPVLEGVITSEGYGSAQYAFSQNGTLVYIAGGPDHYYSELSTIDLDGNVEPLDVPSRLYGRARISPDGKRLVTAILGANASLWVYEFERGTMTRMTRRWDNYSAVWRPSGKEITFGSNRGGDVSIWQISADGGGQPDLLTKATPNSLVGTWTSDGKWLCYTQVSEETNADIWVISSDKPPVSKLIIQTPFQEFHPSFSPDDRWIAYVSDESGRPEVYVQPFPVTGQKWKLSVDGGDSPEWSPDGRKLYYLCGQKIMSVSITAGPEFTPARARTALDIDHTTIFDFDVYPDGQKFLLVGRSHGVGQSPGLAIAGAGSFLSYRTPAKSEIHVAVNWFEEFR